MEVTGWPKTVISRGRIVVEDETLHVARGSGQFLERQAMDPETEGPGDDAPLSARTTFGADLM